MDHNPWDPTTCGMRSNLACAESGRGVMVSHPRVTGGRSTDGTLRISVRRAAPNSLALGSRISLQMSAQFIRLKAD